jgi:hypothetical protein
MGKTAEELRYDIERQRWEVSRDLDALGDKVSPSRVVQRRTDAVKGRFRGMREAVMGTADDVGGRTSDRMGSMNESAHGAVEAVGHAPAAARQRTQGNPMVAGAIAFGLGVLAASVLPESRREHRLAERVQPQLEGAAEKAMEAGRHVAEDLQPSAQEHAAGLQDSARQAASDVAGTAKESASHVQDEARSKAQQARS